MTPARLCTRCCTMSRGAAVALSTLLVALAACGHKEFEPPSDEERVLEAANLYSADAFDTISWDSRDRMLVTGAALYGADCRDCHGTLGRGGTEYAAEHGLNVPSLVGPGWPLDGDVQGVRQRIFTGHVGGMPTHGIGVMSPREIDAVARYLVEQLRPEILGSLASGVS